MKTTLERRADGVEGVGLCLLEPSALTACDGHSSLCLETLLSASSFVSEIHSTLILRGFRICVSAYLLKLVTPKRVLPTCSWLFPDKCRMATNSCDGPRVVSSCLFLSALYTVNECPLECHIFGGTFSATFLGDIFMLLKMVVKWRHLGGSGGEASDS